VRCGVVLLCGVVVRAGDEFRSGVLVRCGVAVRRWAVDRLELLNVLPLCDGMAKSE